MSLKPMIIYFTPLEAFVTPSPHVFAHIRALRFRTILDTAHCLPGSSKFLFFPLHVFSAWFRRPVMIYNFAQNVSICSIGTLLY